MDALLISIGGLLALVLYTYVGYPALLALLPGRRAIADADPAEWPMVSVSLPVYNEAAQIETTLDTLLAADYPADRLQILVVSDASDDGTDEKVEAYAARGVELIRMPARSGKTAAENAAEAHVRGDIIVNTDASVRVHPAAIKALVRAFADPTVGVASSRDASIDAAGGAANAGEAGYVGYEMWVRGLESRRAGIIGASGSLYAIRGELHHYRLPPSLSRDFSAALVAREHGYRAVSVNGAICYVPRTHSLRREYRRKVRTMLRGMETLLYKRRLLNPFSHGAFAWMLFSHKVCRWLIPPAALTVLLVAAIALPLRYPSWPVALALPALAALGVGVFAVAWRWPAGKPMPSVVEVPAYVLGGNLAAVEAWLRVAHGDRNPVWEPTRRETAPVAGVGQPSA